jgi:hypothetical protein
MPTGARDPAPDVNILAFVDGDSAGIGEEDACGTALKGNSEKQESAQVYRPRGQGHRK